MAEPYEVKATTELVSVPTTIDITELTALANKLIETQNTKPSLKSKLTSRKFWVSAAGCVTGICGMIGCSESTTAIIAFAIVEVVSIIVYCVSEGTMDAMHKKQLMAAISSMIAMITDAVNTMTVTNVNSEVAPTSYIAKTPTAAAYDPMAPTNKDNGDDKTFLA